MTLLAGALLGILEETGESILILTEGIEPEEFFASKLTQQQVLNCIRTMTETAANVPAEIKQRLLEIDWAGWAMLGGQLNREGGFERDAVWFCIRSLVPATLMWLRVFQKSAPELFSLAP